MKNLFYFAISFGLVLSCGSGEAPLNETASSPNNNDTLTIDSIIIDNDIIEERITINIVKLLDKFEGAFELPYSLDSTGIDAFVQNENSPNLSNIEVQYLSKTPGVSSIGGVI